MHLTTVLANYQRLLGEHAQPLPYLSDLISLEAARRQENGVKARIAAAHFPTLKTIEAFDFALQPELPKAKLLEHFEGTFVEAHRNLILSGPPGVGKSHILSAIGLAMCMRGYRVLFTTAAALLMKLIAAKKSTALERHYRSFDRIDLLLIDELDTFRSNEKRPIYFFNSYRNATNDAALPSRRIFRSKSGPKSFPTRWPLRPSSIGLFITVPSSLSRARVTGCVPAGNPPRMFNDSKGSLLRRRYRFKFRAPFPRGNVAPTAASNTWSIETWATSTDHGGAQGLKDTERRHCAAPGSSRDMATTVECSPPPGQAYGGGSRWMERRTCSFPRPSSATESEKQISGCQGQ